MCEQTCIPFLLISLTFTGSVTEANSVLRYGPKEGYSDYAHSEFTPIFFEEISASDKQAAENVCGAADRACIYDFVVSGSEGFALKTKECRKEALEENAASRKLIVCMILKCCVRNVFKIVLL